ncbi:MAG: SAM-dependent methyltransferase, partial [Gammaproteobacteria bacterium]|nr:SAM-dependent methyltransferase [Gammaproteobacteria bacterium]
EVIYDDARHFIATTDESFDIITSDPIHPWFRGAATLYSSEYFELVKAHLNPGGLVTQWVPPYQSTEAVVKSQIATFLKVFPDGTVWHTNLEDESYDLVLLGQQGPLEIDVVAVREKLDRNELVENSLIQVGYDSLERLLTAYATQRSDLESWLQDAQINHDRRLRHQYMAGLAWQVFNSLNIYESLIRYRKYPDGIFIAPVEEQAELRQAFEGRRIDLGVPNR